jgi:PREDICTED: similar to reO_6
MDRDKSLADFEADGLRFIRSAIEFDQKNDLETALSCYQEGVYNLYKAFEKGSSINDLEYKIKQYLNRAEVIGDSIRQKNKFTYKPAEADLSRACFLLNQALDEDQAGHSEEAVELYLDAVDLCLKAVSF